MCALCRGVGYPITVGIGRIALYRQWGVAFLWRALSPYMGSGGAPRGAPEEGRRGYDSSKTKRENRTVPTELYTKLKIDALCIDRLGGFIY
jgi:hypothetical protein